MGALIWLAEYNAVTSSAQAIRNGVTELYYRLEIDFSVVKVLIRMQRNDEFCMCTNAVICNHTFIYFCDKTQDFVI